MGAAIRELCVLSLFFGLAMSAAPEGGAKRVMGILCSVMLIIVIIEPLKGFDYVGYARSLADYRTLESSLAEDGQEMRRRLDRLVIEQHCEAYIMDKAEALGLELESVSVETDMYSDGVWLPYSAKLNGRGDPAACSVLSEIIAAELGIAPERQMWTQSE